MSSFAPLLGLLAVMLFLGACETSGGLMTQTGLGQLERGETKNLNMAPGVEDSAVAALGVPLPHLFMGQTLPMLSTHFGAADLTRREGEATIHRFRTRSRRGPCVLLAILYDERGGEPRIRHIAVREDGAPAPDPAWCMGRLAWSHQKSLAG